MLSHVINLFGALRLHRSIRILLAAGLFAFTATSALAQTGGEGALEGTVTDPTGAAIPNAAVTAINQASNVSTARTSTSAGLYSITPLIPGVYTITVTANGFSTLTQKNIEVNGLTVTGFNPKLSPGAVDESVTVSEAPPLLQTTSPSVEAVITQQTYESLPLVMNNQQRDPSALATLSVGAQGGTRAPIFSGTGNYLAEVYLDGIPTTTSNQQGDNRVVSNGVPVESVEQLQIISSGPSAEYQGAGAVGFTIKSGGYQYHGQILDVFRNTALDTWGFPGNQQTKNALVNGKIAQVPAGKPIEHQNELSVSAGGPIPFTHHKGFFFANYDKFHSTVTSNPAKFTVPTALMRQGDFTELNCPAVRGTYVPGCIGTGSPAPTPTPKPATTLSSTTRSPTPAAAALARVSRLWAPRTGSLPTTSSQAVTSRLSRRRSSSIFRCQIFPTLLSTTTFRTASADLTTTNSSSRSTTTGVRSSATPSSTRMACVSPSATARCFRCRTRMAIRRASRQRCSSLSTRTRSLRTW